MTTTETGPLIEAGRITFRGMSMEQDNLPVLDDERLFSVRATCVAVERQRMADGEERLVAKMMVDRVWEGQGSEPASTDPALFDGEGDPTSEATGEGWENPDLTAPQPGDADYVEPGSLSDAEKRKLAAVPDPFATGGEG